MVIQRHGWQRRLRAPLRVVRQRPRLFISAAIGLAVVVLLPAAWHLPPLLIGWNVGVGLYLALAWRLMARADVNSIRWRAAKQDEGRLTMLVLTVGAALASLGAIVVELGHGGSKEGMHLALAALTILLSWFFTHTIFALHYAHEFYAERGASGGGLAFPGGADPDYWDFIYFSFVIGMTAQVSDVGITARSIRRMVTAHGVVSFLFNVAFLALMVNIAAGAF